MKEKDDKSLMITNGGIDIQAGYVYVYLLKNGKINKLPIQVLSFYNPKEGMYYILCLDLGIHSYADTLDNASKQLLEMLKVMNKPEHAGRKVIPFGKEYFDLFYQKKKALNNLKATGKPLRKINMPKTKIKDEINLALCY